MFTDSVTVFRPMYTYFISNGTSVKIGKTRSVQDRIATLQTSSHTKLALLLALPGDREKEHHDRFKEYRQEGEWFLLSEPLQSYIMAHREQQYAHYLETVVFFTQKQHIVADGTWLEVLSAFLTQIPPHSDGRRRVSVDRLWKALGMSTRQDRPNSLLLTATMRVLGYERTRVREGEVKVGFISHASFCA